MPLCWVICCDPPPLLFYSFDKTSDVLLSFLFFFMLHWDALTSVFICIERLNDQLRHGNSMRLHFSTMDSTLIRNRVKTLNQWLKYFFMKTLYQISSFRAEFLIFLMISLLNCKINGLNRLFYFFRLAIICHKNHIFTLLFLFPTRSCSHIIKLCAQTATSIWILQPTLTRYLLCLFLLPVPSSWFHPAPFCCRRGCLWRIRHCFPDSQASHPSPLIGRHNPPIHQAFVTLSLEYTMVRYLPPPPLLGNGRAW